jgi:lipopolysaccharide transport system ATP-binding protein
MERGYVRQEGKTDEVVAKYLAAMVTRGRKEVMEEEAVGRPLEIGADLDLSEQAFERMPKFVTTVLNVDHRYGSGKARVQGIGVFGREGYPVTGVEQGDRICVRISVEFLDRVEHPNVGFMLRNRLGQDVAGTNLLYEGVQLPPTHNGDRISVDFIMDLPYLHAGFYHFAPAVADGTLDQYEMCDWIDNASAMEVIERTTTYGHMRIPMRVRTTNIGTANVSDRVI